MYVLKEIPTSFDPELKAELAEADAMAEAYNSHFISKLRNKPIHIFAFIQDEDPAKKVCQSHEPNPTWLLRKHQDFLPKLQDHILGQLLFWTFDSDTYGPFTKEEHNQIRIVNNTIYHVNTVCIKYTTYDMQREYNIVNPYN